MTNKNFSIVIFHLIFCFSLLLGAQKEGDDITLKAGKYTKLHSRILNEERTVLVSVPFSYRSKPDKRYPVLYILDGTEYFLLWGQLSCAMDVDLPHCIVVAIKNVDRIRDMTRVNTGKPWPTSGGMNKFMDFIGEELIPFIDNNYRTTGYRILFGKSAAGQFTIMTMLHRPEFFDAFIARSPMFGTDFDYIVDKTHKLFVNSKSFNKNLYITYGENDYPGVTIYAQKYKCILDGLATAGLKYHFEVAKDKGHAYFSCLNSGLIWIFEDYGFPTEDFLCFGEEAIIERIRSMSKKYMKNFTMQDVCSALEIRDAVGGLIQKRRFDDAIRILHFSKKFFTDKSEWLYHLAQTYYHAGETEKAISTYRELLKMKLHPKIEGMARIFFKIALEENQR